MKTNKIDKKLVLTKTTVANLVNDEMNTARGGLNTIERTCYSVETSCVYTACTCASCFDC